MQGYRNDAVHPTLRRALPMAQTDLDGRRGRDRNGDCTLLESMGAGGLTDFTFGATTTKTSWSVNPYSGCQHACSYCYVPDTIKAQRHRWGKYAIVKRDLPTRLAKAMAAGTRRTVYLSTATDPYQPVEAEARITRRCLEALVRRDWPVEVLTRSPLVLRDLDLLKQFSQVRVGLSIPTLDDQVRRALEPRAPPIAARLRTLRRLSDSGIPTFANITPACPPTTHTATEIARTMLDAGAQWINSKGLQRKETVLLPMWDRLHATKHRDIATFFGDEARQAVWHRELGAAFGALGMAFSTPFFNPPFDHLVEPERGPRQAKLDERPTIELVVTARPKRAPAPTPIARWP